MIKLLKYPHSISKLDIEKIKIKKTLIYRQFKALKIVEE